MSARSVYRWTMLSIIVACAVVSYVVLTRRHPDRPVQPGPRPNFQLPFPCGERWRLTTYPGHDDYDIDFFAAEGESGGRTVVASAPGTVTWAGWSATLDNGAQAAPGASGTRGGLGFGVIIDHGGGWFTTYGHLAGAPGVRTGDRVGQAQPLGQVGHTGSTKVDHLHYEQLDDTRDPRHTRGVQDKVESIFDGVPSGITSDGSAATGPLRTAGPQSPDQTRTSRNCG
ncbi:M23 family metallopeptidase [Dactylosporangium darangshiense]|uniref:M23ase beta-sheet core domain-containing protein n=1 Tax=Dactylosporangium darangshiense TaxID=579108 RepID=A0ABP8D8X6_9ACTN